MKKKYIVVALSNGNMRLLVDMVNSDASLPFNIHPPPCRPSTHIFHGMPYSRQSCSIHTNRKVSKLEPIHRYNVHTPVTHSPINLWPGFWAFHLKNVQWWQRIYLIYAEPRVAITKLCKSSSLVLLYAIQCFLSYAYHDPLLGTYAEQRKTMISDLRMWISLSIQSSSWRTY